MNKDRVEGKVKDVTGRIERQAGEWTADPKKQVHGAAKQVEGKIQNTLGKAEDAVKKESGKAKVSSGSSKPAQDEVGSEEEAEERRRSG